jgi:hypothetical protein
MEVYLVVVASLILPTIIVAVIFYLYKKQRRETHARDAEHSAQKKLIGTLENIVEERGETINILRTKPMTHHEHLN